MKINPNLSGFDISSKGLAIQRKKMNLIAENIAYSDNVRTEDGQPYKRKYLSVVAKEEPIFNNKMNMNQSIPLITSNDSHISSTIPINKNYDTNNIIADEKTDQKEGEVLYMPDHPDADQNGYVKMSNVNVINEMVDMIAASRSYEANLTAFNSSKQMAKDSLDI
jgi:flagellar basal-body rod protein FlgC